ncbi:hypothetical protein C8R43DRAFT_1128519 [Mycena crocata]|nr:hypothetical protein C8R43DRAFT_1128519 [Mycena crocata]
MPRVAPTKQRPRAAPTFLDPNRPRRGPYVSHGFEAENDIYRLDKFVDLQPRFVAELARRSPLQPFLGTTPAPAAPPRPMPTTDKEGRRIVDLRQIQEHHRLVDAASVAAAKDAEKRKVEFLDLHTREIAARVTADVIAAVPGQDREFPPLREGLQFDPAVMVGQEYTLDEVCGPQSVLGLRRVLWGGDSAMPLVDFRNQVVGVLGGTPTNPGWPKDVEAATLACADVAPWVRCSKEEQEANASPTLSGGLGLVHEGEEAPVPEGRSAILDAVTFGTLFTNPAVRRITGYASGLFSLFAFRLHVWFPQALQVYEDHYAGSARFLSFGVFAAATFVFGCNPLPLFDDDIATGWAALTALGTYDWRRGGHIILWDLNIVVPFPPGCTILIPRAAVRYSFVKIAPGETRYCLIQHTPAAVFNFASNDGRSNLDFAMHATEEEHMRREQRRQRESAGDYAFDNLSFVSQLHQQVYLLPYAED